MNKNMKKLFSILTILTFFGQAAFGDYVIKGENKEEGKIKFAASGLILLNQNGSEKVFKREAGDDYFDDTIFYKTKLLSSKYEEVPCRITKVNKTNAEFYTEGNEFNKVSKLKIKNMVINIF